MKLKTKAQAVKLFGNQSTLAKALGISRSSLCEWEDQLTERRINEITGIAYRLGMLKPCQPGNKRRAAK